MTNNKGQSTILVYIHKQNSYTYSGGMALCIIVYSIYFRGYSVQNSEYIN